MSRVVCWFSCGAASAVATKLMLEKDPVIAYCHVANEHPDNLRFLHDCESWLGKDITIISSTKYRDCWQVWEEVRYLNGPIGARCTTEMKKKVRREFSQHDDLQVFGFTSEEEHRALRFEKNNPEVRCAFPLIEQKLTKAACLEWITYEGLQLPAMYRLGYHNANCIGCVKGGMGYWNKIRKDFPETFSRMALLERKIGASCMNGIYLDELDPERGHKSDLDLPECGLFCGESNE